MKTTNLDLALALAGVARGFTASRKDNDNISIINKNGFIYVHKEKGKDCRIEHSALWLDWDSQCWYLIGDDKTWLNKEVIKGE